MNRTLVGENYSYATMQSQYSTAPVDWANCTNYARHLWEISMCSLRLCGKMNKRIGLTSPETLWCELAIWFSFISVHFVRTEQTNGCTGSSPSDSVGNFAQRIFFWRKSFNLFKSFTARSFYLSFMAFLVWFHGISTIVGYLKPNHFLYIYIKHIFRRRCLLYPL